MILNLVINNSKIDIYKKMYDVLSPFYKNLDFVKTYFVEYDETLRSEYEINEDVLKIRGVESMIPGLLHKTIDALLILRRIGQEYKWCIRSNVSTVVNFRILKLLLTEEPNIDYFGAAVYRVDGLDPFSGIVDQDFFGHHFAQGTMIGLSSKYVDALLLNRHKLHFKLMDDVSIGVFVGEYLSNEVCRYFPNNLLVVVSNEIHCKKNIKNYNEINNPVAWRNKGADRNIDLINMKTITGFLNKI